MSGRGTGTRLPGAHNYRALTHNNARFLRAIHRGSRLALSLFFSMMCFSLFLPPPPSHFSFRLIKILLSVFHSRTNSLGLSPRPLPAKLGGSEASAPSMKIAGGPRSPLRDNPLTRLPSQHSQQDAPSLEHSIPLREATLGGFNL